jgi:hypothetical protein
LKAFRAPDLVDIEFALGPILGVSPAVATPFHGPIQAWIDAKPLGKRMATELPDMKLWQ